MTAHPFVSSREQGQVVEVDGVKTFYSERGSGAPLLLVHGSAPGIDGAMAWDPVLDELAGFRRTIVVDAPGYGESEMLPAADTPRNVALHLVQLLDTLGVGELAVVGHSRGGRISSELAFAIGERITRLVILCAGSVAPGGHLTDEGEWTPSAVALVRFGADGDTSLETFKSAYRTTVARPLNIPDDVLEDLYERFVATRLDEYLRRMVELDPLAFYHLDDAELFQASLRRLPMPVSVIWGRDDVTSSYRRAVELLEVIPDVELHVLPRCGHFPQYDRPDALAGLIKDFLTRGA
jgi:2-hydroxy-6-oxonona-2,4-dienedioate hydrolase/4,5:9,10-diseco-3-hydroxy-5,9,17-trioxoandrosta-1(10),2-diene-4-oate hydrolase